MQKGELSVIRVDLRLRAATAARGILATSTAVLCHDRAGTKASDGRTLTGKAPVTGRETANDVRRAITSAPPYLRPLVNGFTAHAACSVVF